MRVLTKPEESSEGLRLVTTLGAPRRNLIRNNIRSIPTRMHTQRNGDGNPPTKRKQTIQRVEDEDDDRTAETLRLEARCADRVEPRQERDDADKDGIVDLRGAPAGGLVGDEGGCHGKDDDVKDKLDRADDPSDKASGMHGESEGVCVCEDKCGVWVFAVLRVLGRWIASRRVSFEGSAGFVCGGVRWFAGRPSLICEFRIGGVCEAILCYDAA